ncbi:MAG: uncharacterized protein KVP18_004855 [Porospora cf. gigantea A]|uniref:uncharacterized protein n=1 Tax=Porospora cf. gigantea A TaxID=2853593 RepID=UPI00355A3473|nr:MAG: hypothetical protein KVP18_004855 [Porospora cf. gigantea A]
MRLLVALCSVVQACSERAAAIRLRTHGFALVCDWSISPSCPFLAELNAVDAWSSVLAAKGHLYREMQYNAAVKEQLRVTGCYDCGYGWRAFDITRNPARTNDLGRCLEVENLVSGSGYIQVALEGDESCEMHVFGDVSGLPAALEALRGAGGTLRYHFTMLHPEVTPEPEWVTPETFQEDYTGGTMSGPFESLHEIVEEAWRRRRTIGFQGRPSGPYPEFTAVGLKGLGATVVRDVPENLERVVSALRLGVHLGPVTENFTLPRYNPKTFKRVLTSKGNKDALETRRLLKPDAADFLRQALLMQQVLPSDYPFLHFSLITSDVTQALQLRGDVQGLPASLAVSFTEPLGSSLNAVLARVPNSEVVDALKGLNVATAGGVARLQQVYGSSDPQPPVTSFPTPLVFLNGVRVDMDNEQQLQSAILQENQIFLEWLLSRPSASELRIDWMTHLCSMTECTAELWADGSLLVTPTHARFTPRLTLACWRALANRGPAAPTAATAGLLADASGSPVAASRLPLACRKSRVVPYLASDTCEMVAIGGFPFPVTDSLRDLGGYLRFLLSHAHKAGAVLLSDLLGPTFFVGPEMSAESMPSRARGLTVYVAANPLSVLGQQMLLGLDALQGSSDFQVSVSPLLPPSPENAALRVGLKLGITANAPNTGTRAANIGVRSM